MPPAHHHAAFHLTLKSQRVEHAAGVIGGNHLQHAYAAVFQRDLNFDCLRAEGVGKMYRFASAQRAGFRGVVLTVNCSAYWRRVHQHGNRLPAGLDGWFRAGSFRHVQARSFGIQTDKFRFCIPANCQVSQDVLFERFGGQEDGVPCHKGLARGCGRTAVRGKVGIHHQNIHIPRVPRENLRRD